MEAKTCALSKILEADKEEARKQKEISGLRRGFYPPMKKTQSLSKSQPKSKAESQKKSQALRQIGDYIDALKWSLHSDNQARIRCSSHTFICPIKHSFKNG